ncbi:2-hydroxychromene-2-carboxylate isomerase [Rhodobacteraceae bacterium KMM 6894]|nr:2-hydroxychromene-2-carboxylate isomerase [Rhodobacteraceae bacterium KMM 6894]
MAHIDYFFSTLSPFTYLSGVALRDIATRTGASVTYRPMDIMALFARTGGLPPKDRHPSRQAYRLQDMERRARRLGLPLTMKPAFWPTNSAPSSYAIIAAQEAGGGDLAQLVHVVGRAIWVEDRDIAQEDVLRDCLSAAGFDPDLANNQSEQAADAYAANLDDAERRGVFGAPTYVVDDGQVFWGQDRLEDLELHLAGRS